METGPLRYKQLTVEFRTNFRSRKTWAWCNVYNHEW